MTNGAFDDPRLAELYDAVNSDHRDLDVYADIVTEFGARSVLDIGCGTGTFACLLAKQGLEVVGVDPSGASLEVARRKPAAGRVRWLHGDATMLPPLQVDMATMTGNVAQVFLTDDAWNATLTRVRAALRPGGRLVFETRDPARRAWLEWNRERTHTRITVPDVGVVETWIDLVGVEGALVTIRGNYVFELDGTVLTSDETLRFRERQEVENSLRAAGFVVDEVRDAPDRPGREFVFVASRGA